jgi:hypothetical protein
MIRQRISAKADILPKPSPPGDELLGNELLGATWLVEDIGGRGVIDFLQSTLTFDSEEKVSGMGGCNNFFGSVKIDGHAIEFGPIGATRMAGMRQGNRRSGAPVLSGSGASSKLHLRSGIAVALGQRWAASDSTEPQVVTRLAGMARKA